MSHSRKLLVPAVLAFGVFAAGAALIGFDDANAGGHRGHGMAAAGNPGGAGGEKQGGGNGGGKQGGGDGSGKQGGGNDGGHHGHGDGGGEFNFGDNGGGEIVVGGGGGPTSDESHRITCVINGQLVPVRSVSECRYGFGHTYHGDSYFGGAGYNGGYVVRHVQHRFQAHIQYNGSMGGSGGYATGCDCGGGYGFGGAQFVGSRAAVMQAEHRAREAALDSYSYSGGYAAGYGFAGYGGNFAAGHGYAYGMGDSYGYRYHQRVHMRHLRRMPAYFGYGNGFDSGYAGGCACNGSDFGYMYNYGPALSKGGGY